LLTHKLEYLSLSHNKFLSLRNGLMFSGNSLRILDISYCNISRIEDTTFRYGVANLKELYLQHNAIRYISYDSFSSLKNLTILNIACNKLYSFHTDMFVPLKGLTTLIIGNNFSACNCYLRVNYSSCLRPNVRLEHASCTKDDENCKTDCSQISDITKCTSSYEMQIFPELGVRDHSEGSDSEDSGGVSAVVIAATALLVVVIVIVICACMLSRSHSCLGAMGCALICTECLCWYRVHSCTGGASE
jgi:hypothetical protein